VFSLTFERELLFGRWFREELEDENKKTIEYAQLSADGSFEFTFMTLETKTDIADKIVDQVTELGDWGLVGDIHFTLTKSELVDNELYSADLANSDNYHAYRILQLNSQVFEYQHIVTNEVFIMRRVVGNIAHC